MSPWSGWCPNSFHHSYHILSPLTCHVLGAMAFFFGEILGVISVAWLETE